MNRLRHPAASCRMLFLLLLAGTAVFGQERVRVEVSTGYQRQGLRWSIAGNSAGRAPNVYSELKWRGVSGVFFGGALTWNMWRRWVVFGEGSRVFTLSGRISDTDYGGDNRTDPTYAGRFDSHKGYGYAVSSGVGYRVFADRRFILTPFLGYGWSGQSLSVTDGGLLNSWYRTTWKGGLVRVLGEWNVRGRWGVYFSGGYHQVSYRADADWNLITSFVHPVSFRHWADGYGLEGVAGVRYGVGKGVQVFLAGNYFSWRTGKGVDELYLVSGQTSQTQLNEVVLSGGGVKAGVRWAW